MKKAAAVVSGGIDSITNALMLLEQSYEVHLLNITYGQRCELGEKLAVEAITKELQSRGYNCYSHIVEARWLGMLGGSALTDRSIPVPNGFQDVVGNTIPQLFVPARNVVFIAMAAALAESKGAEVITLGANQSEISYPDNTDEFLRRFTRVLESGCFKVHPKVISPEWELDKAEIIKWGYDNGFDYIYDLTYSSDDEPILISGCPPNMRKSYMTSGRDGCSRNRRMAYYILDKLYPGRYPDNQAYANPDWFHDVFLYKLKKGELDFSHLWFYKYKEVL